MDVPLYFQKVLDTMHLVYIIDLTMYACNRIPLIYLIVLVLLFIQSACEAIIVIIGNILNQVGAVWLAWVGFLKLLVHMWISICLSVCVCPPRCHKLLVV